MFYFNYTCKYISQWCHNAGINFNQYMNKCIPEAEDIIFKKQQYEYT